MSAQFLQENVTKTEQTNKTQSLHVYGFVWLYCGKHLQKWQDNTHIVLFTGNSPFMSASPSGTSDKSSSR